MNQVHQNFAEWEKTLVNKEKLKVLQIPREVIFESKSEIIEGRSTISFTDSKLVIKKEDYPQLEIIYANNCGLTSVELDVPTLTGLYLNGNELKNIDLNQAPNLENLFVSNNKLEDLKVTHLKNLKTLWCFKNCLRKLDCNGLNNLEELDCSEQPLIKLNLEDCQRLQIVNCDLSDIDELDCFSNLPNLRELSLSSRYYLSDQKEKKLILNSPFLTYLNIRGSNIEQVIYQTPIVNREKLKIVDDNLNESYGMDEGDDNKWEQFELDNKKRPWKKEYLDPSNENYSKSLISIDLGDIFLEEVIIKNALNLKRIIVENCPQLQFYHGERNEQFKKTSFDTKVYNEESSNSIKQDEINELKEKESIIKEKDEEIINLKTRVSEQENKITLLENREKEIIRLHQETEKLTNELLEIKKRDLEKLISNCKDEMEEFCHGYLEIFLETNNQTAKKYLLKIFDEKTLKELIEKKKEIDYLEQKVNQLSQQAQIEIMNK